MGLFVKSIFANFAESIINDENIEDILLAIVAGVLLALLIIILITILRRKQDIYIINELGDNRSEIVRILVEKVGFDVRDVVAILKTTSPFLVVNKVSRGDARKIARLFEKENAKVKIVRSGKSPIK